MAKDNSHKVKISIGDATIEIEGEVSGVTKIVDSLKSVLQGRPSISDQSAFQTTRDGQSKDSIGSELELAKDIRTFFKEKGPRNQLEAAAVVAFYLQYVENEAVKRREAIDTGVLKDEFRKADYPLPKVPNQVLIDAKKTGYFDVAGTGQYKLNSVGYNLVKFALGKGGEDEKIIKRRPRKKNTKRVKGKK